jgi:uncharacterized protein (DUF427 family)
VLAESSHTVKLEGNHYFSLESLRREYFSDSPTSSTCPWKGQARYYHIRVDGKTNPDAAWYYPEPSPAASVIASHVAFWHGVSVQRVPGPGEGTAPGTGARTGLAGRVRARLRRMQGQR